MSYGSWAVNDTNAVKKWAMEVAQAERDSLDIMPLIGDDDDSIIHRKKEIGKGAGDQVTFNLRARPTQKGIGASQRAEGNAESLSIYADSLLVNEIGANFGAPSEYTIDQQRVPFDLREQCKNANKDWWVDRLSKTFFNVVCGYTPANVDGATSGTLYTGLNTVTAPAGTGRQIWAGSATTDQGLTSADTFTLALIDKAVEAARTGNSMVRPVKVGGKEKYVMYLHESQVTALRTSTSQGGWQDITKYSYSGVDVGKNPLYNGSLGEYNNVILRRSQDVTKGVQSASPTVAVDNTRRAVLLGAQSCAVAYGTKYTEGRRYRWSEKLLDHDRLLEVATFSIMGMKKCVFNSTDHGVVVVSTYSSS
jgi:N4-gp56 family major capsid protein